MKTLYIHPFGSPLVLGHEGLMDEGRWMILTKSDGLVLVFEHWRELIGLDELISAPRMTLDRDSGINVYMYKYVISTYKKERRIHCSKSYVVCRHGRNIKQYIIIICILTYNRLSFLFILPLLSSFPCQLLVISIPNLPTD